VFAEEPVLGGGRFCGSARWVWVWEVCGWLSVCGWDGAGVFRGVRGGWWCERRRGCGQMPPVCCWGGEWVGGWRGGWRVGDVLGGWCGVGVGCFYRWGIFGDGGGVLC